MSLDLCTRKVLSYHLPEHKLGKTHFKDTEGLVFDQLILPQIHPSQAVTALAIRFGKNQRDL